MKALLDTNVVIDLQKGLLARSLPRGLYLLSVISELDEQVKDNTVRLRRMHRLRLPDAIIAASAVAHNAILLTNDQRLLAIPEVQSEALVLKHDSA